MTTAHPRDPRLRRHQPGDALSAAVRLELAADTMRAHQLDRGAEPEPAAERYVDSLEQLADVAAHVQLGVVEPPLTAAEFAAALEQPAPVAPVPPAPGAPAPAPDVAAKAEAVLLPEVFSSERGRFTRTLTWRSRHDPESLRYGVAERLHGRRAPLQDVLLPTGPVLDQGAEGECVTFALTAALNTLELLDGDDDDPMFGAELARELFPLAQRADEIPGEEYLGTSILGGLAAAREAGHIGGYLWAFGTRDIAQNLTAHRRPVVVGVSWLAGMYDTGPGGLVELTGDDEGLGHALAVVGIRLKGPQGQPGPFFVWQNSWGTGYGAGGFGYVHHRDLSLLLRGRGEAGIPTREPQVPR